MACSIKIPLILSSVDKGDFLCKIFYDLRKFISQMLEKLFYLHLAIGGRVPYAATEATIGTFATVGTYRSFAQRTTQIRIVAGATIRALFACGAIYLVRVTVTPQNQRIIKHTLTVRPPGSTVVTLTTNHANLVRMSTLRTHRLLLTICGRGRIGGDGGQMATQVLASIFCLVLRQALVIDLVVPSLILHRIGRNHHHRLCCRSW